MVRLDSQSVSRIGKGAFLNHKSLVDVFRLIRIEKLKSAPTFVSTVRWQLLLAQNRKSSPPSVLLHIRGENPSFPDFWSGGSHSEGGRPAQTIGAQGRAEEPRADARSIHGAARGRWSLQLFPPTCSALLRNSASESGCFWNFFGSFPECVSAVCSVPRCV